MTSGVDVGRPTWCQTGCRCRDSRRKSAPGKCFRYGLATQDLVSHDVHGLRTAIANEGWPPIYMVLAGRVGIVKTAEMGGAISSVAGENRSKLPSHSVSRQSQTCWKPWECKFVE